MISFTEQQTQYGDLSGNTSPANLARGAKLANIEHRYLLQKYFNNEGSFSITTVGTQNLTAAAAISAGAMSATLTAPWAYYTTGVQTKFSSGDLRTVQFIKGSTAITWSGGLSANATAALSVGGIQFYPAPPNYSKLKTVTITVGDLKWTPQEILTREEWDQLNVFPYYADIPKNYFVFPGGDRGAQIGIWPIPSTTGNLITYNYKFRVPDLSLIDSLAGTVSVTNGSSAVAGSGTAFVPTVNTQNESRWIQIAQPKGDNLWYQISSVDSTTGITLLTPYQGVTVSGGSYTIGQMPLLMEDFQDMLIWKPLMFYYSTIAKDTDRFDEFKGLYDEKLKQLNEYAGQKSIHVNLGRRPNYVNPNLFWQG